MNRVSKTTRSTIGEIKPRLRAVIYCRVSSARQRDAHTIESQLRELPLLVERRGWDLVKPADTYVDDGKSARAGKLHKRRGFLRLLADAAAGEFDVVVVVDMDRISRTDDPEERGKIQAAFKRAGVLITTLTSGDIDLNTQAGELQGSFGLMFASWDNDKRSKRAILARATSIARGHKPFGRDPYALRWDNTMKAMTIVDAESRIVVEVFERVADSESCEAIAQDFNAREIPRRGGGRWLREGVWKLARSRVYVGEWTVKVPAIVDEALWQRANDALQRRGGRRAAKMIGRVVYLLQGIAVCLSCGAPMGVYAGSAKGTPGKGFHHPRYVCTHHRRQIGERQRCPAQTVRVDDTDDRLWAALVELLQRPDIMQRGVDARNVNSSDARHWEHDLKEWRRKLRHLDGVEDTVSTQHRRGSLTSRGYAKELEQLQRERAMLEQQIASAERAITSAATRTQRDHAASALLAQLRGKLGTVDKSERRRMVQALIEPGGISIGRDGIRGNVKLRIGAAEGSASGSSRPETGCNTRRGLHADVADPEPRELLARLRARPLHGLVDVALPQLADDRQHAARHVDRVLGVMVRPRAVPLGRAGAAFRSAGAAALAAVRELRLREAKAGLHHRHVDCADMPSRSDIARDAPARDDRRLLLTRSKVTRPSSQPPGSSADEHPQSNRHGGGFGVSSHSSPWSSRSESPWFGFGASGQLSSSFSTPSSSRSHATTIGTVMLASSKLSSRTSSVTGYVPGASYACSANGSTSALVTPSPKSHKY